MELTLIQVDAFSNRPFQGNPAAVCVTDTPLEENLMQAIAQEMNLSETAFLVPIEGGYHLRWFTPAAEVDLCGHATLASAHVLWQEGYLSADATAKFSTKSGWLSAKQDGDWIAMDFPSQPVTANQYIMPQLVKALCCHSNIRAVSKNDTNYLVELQSESAIGSLQPDFSEMQKLPVQGVIATAAADSGECDFVSRYFAPAVGVDEDPVTGSAHASLAPYWQEKLGKSSMVAKQISARGGILRISCQPENRVQISGRAVTVLKGKLRI
ncbi:MAG: PhzF family phenazine biosynthesis protein [Cyanobacteria bacterium J06626_6]